MITKFPITTLPTNTPNLQPPVILSNLQNGVEYTVTIIAHLADGTTITESRKVTPYAGPKPAPPVVLTKNGLGLTGTGLPNSIIRLYDDLGVLVAEVEVDSTGNWSIPVSMFPGGTTVGFSGSLTLTDINGNTSDPTPINSIDSIPPANAVIGSITGDGMSGTAEPGSTVNLLDENGDLITSVIVDSDGNWFIPGSSFPGGVVSPFTGSIVVVDPDGNESGSINLNILIDTTPPFPPIPTIQNATGLSGIAEPGSTINLYDSNGNLVATVVADSSGNWTIPASSFPGGATDGFNGSIVSVDATGNISPPTVILTIDGIAPSAPIITIANASRLSGTAEANTIIKLYDSLNALISTTVVDVLGNWTFTPDKFPGGITDGFTGTLTSTDLAGNVSVATPVPIIDGLAPNPPIITVANASGLFGTAEPLAVIRMYNSFGILVAGTTADNLGNWSILPNQFPGNVINGYTGYLTQTDIAGNTSNQTPIPAIDGIPPNAPICTVANYYGISGTAEAGSRISIKDSNGVEIAFTFTDMNGNWSVPASSFPGQATNGFIGSITATDLAGNESSATPIPIINGVLPVTSLTTYTDNIGSFQSATSTAPTTDDTKPGMNIGTGITDTPKLYIDNVLTSATYDSVAGTLTPNVPLADGSYNFTYTLTDSIGNISLPSAALSIAVDTTKPTTPVAPTTYSDDVGSVQSATSNALTTDDTTPGINIGTGLTDVVKLYIDNALVTSTYDSVAGTLTPNTPLIHGTYSFSYTLTDAAGNESDKSASFVIMLDLLAPATPIAPTTYVDNVGSVTSNTSVAPETDDTTPGINIGSGLTDAPQLYVDGILTASTYNSVDGTLTSNSALSQGIKVITYTLTDAAGNESGQSPAITITINTTPPTTTNIMSYVDNVGIVQSTTSVALSTDDTTPGINIGTGLTTIPKLYIGGVLTAATYNSIVGTLTPNTPLTQGTYSFTYTLTDVVGNESLPSAAFSITVDTTSPTTPVSAPLSYNDNVGNIQSATSTAIITDDTTPGINVGAGLTDTVNLYINSSLIVSVYNAITGTLTPFYPLAEGTYAFSYTLSDAIGNESGQSPSITITIDIIPPTTPVSKPSSYIDNVGSIQSTTSNDAITDDATPGINIGAGLTNTPKLYVNGIFTAATYVSGTGIITPNSPLSDGLKTITYTLSDVAGNESGQSPAITFTIDTVSPLVSTPPTSYDDNVGIIQGTSSTLPFTDDNRPAINIGTGLTDIVKLYIDGVLKPSTYNSVAGTLTPTLPVPDGLHNFAYSLTDVAGNESLLSGAISMTIDTTPPTTPTTAPASYVDNVGTIQSTTSTAATTNDTTPGINIGAGLIDTPTLFIDDVLVASTYNSVTGTLTPNVPLTEGEKQFSYKLMDIAGNISGQSPAITITIDITPPPTPTTAPASYVDNVLQITSTASVAPVTNDTTPGINIGSGLTNTPNLYVNGTMVASVYDSVAGTLTPTTASTDGLKSITYTLTDPAGNESGQSPAISITIDTVSPTTSTPTTFLDNVGSYQSPNSVLSITDDNRPGINIGTGLTDTVSLYVDNVLTPASYDSVLGTITPTSPVSEGTHTFAYSLTDAAGNESTPSGVLTLVIDTTPPTTPTNAPSSYVDNVGTVQSTTSSASTTDDTTPGINIPTGLTDTPNLYINDVLVASTYVSATGVLTPNTPLVDGIHDFKYSLTDAAGNESGKSPEFTITIDTTAPPTPSSPPAYFIDNNGNQQTNGVTTTDTQPAIFVGTNLSGTPRLYVNGVLVNSDYNSTTGTLTPSTQQADGLNVFTYTLSSPTGVESGQSPAINITISTGAISLSAYTTIRFGVTWQGPVDLDTVAAAYNSSGVCTAMWTTIHPGAITGLTYGGDITTGGIEEYYILQLPQLADTVVVAVYEYTEDSFNQVTGLTTRIANEGTGITISNFNPGVITKPPGSTPNTTLVIGVFVKINNAWFFRPYNTLLNSHVGRFAIVEGDTLASMGL